jgi:hypothetical protein
MSPTGHFITRISKKKYETGIDERHTTWINPHLPSLGVDTERDFFQWFLNFIKHGKQAKEDDVILVLDGQYSTWRPLLLLERIMLTSFASCLTAATKCNPWIKLSWGP